MKRTRSILAGMSLLLGPIGACDNKPSAPPTGAGASGAAAETPGAKALRYSHEALEFSIAFPEGWKVQKDVETFAIIGVSPQEGEGDLYGENVNVMAITTPPGISLEDFAAIQFDQARAMLEEFSNRGRSFEEINGEHAARFDYVHTVDELRIVSITFIMIRDNIAYAITCSAKQDDYDRYRATMIEIARSFRFTG